MKNTKQRILQKARELFNQEGVSSITLHKISLALGISQGNLNYHFRKKADILSALYYELVESMNQQFEAMAQPTSVLSFLYQSSGKSMAVLYEYRFLLRDLYRILKDQPELKAHYGQLQAIRKTQMLTTFQTLISQGVMRPEEFEGEYHRLYERMNIVGDNWINAHELLNEEQEDPVQHYLSLLFEFIYPYLTEKGKEEYGEIVPSKT